MESFDLVVVGAGISGAALAARAARDGLRVLVLEAGARVGGSIASQRLEDGYWFELGGHTAYSSYRELIGALEACAQPPPWTPRGPSILRLLDGNRVLPGKNVGLFLRQLNKSELLRALPRWIGNRPEGRTVREYYGRFVGPSNFDRVIGPILSAVPSQRADAFPADMLFKKRARRDDVPRSFTLPGGLGSAVESLLQTDRIETRLNHGVASIEHPSGSIDSSFELRADDGTRLRTSRLALAIGAGACSRLLRDIAPDLALLVGGISEVTVDSAGLALAPSRTNLPAATFFIPLRDSFHSIVTRDPVPDPEHRAFTFHFRPGTPPEERHARISAVLGISANQLPRIHTRSATLPSPVLGHAERIARIDASLQGRPLALTGNWFRGLSIEDCVERSHREWERLAGASLSRADG